MVYRQVARPFSPARHVRKYSQQPRAIPPPFDSRRMDRGPYSRPFPRRNFMEDRFPPSVAMDRRNFPRRDLPNHRARPVPYQRRHANNNPSYKAVAPRKGARIVKKKVTKQAKSKEALDMELDTYMGNDAIKSRLDEELAKYIAEGNKEKE